VLVAMKAFRPGLGRSPTSAPHEVQPEQLLVPAKN